MSSDNFVLGVALVVMLVSAVSLGFVYYSVSNYKANVLTGYITSNQSQATVNITVQNNIAVNFTTTSINWGAGFVNASKAMALLDTTPGEVLNGTWVVNTTKLVLENIGTENVSLQIMTGKTNATFIGGDGNASYMINITNNEAGSCNNNSARYTLGVWRDVNNSNYGSYICGNYTDSQDGFGYDDATDSIKIDVKLVIPYNANNGSLGDFITATVTG